MDDLHIVTSCLMQQSGWPNLLPNRAGGCSEVQCAIVVY